MALKGSCNIRWLVNGKDAVGYKIITSATSVLKDGHGAFTPSTISATVVKSVGQTVSGSASEATLQWRTASNGAWSTITQRAAQIIPSGCSLIEFKAVVDGVAVATADVRVVLADQQGPQGNKGAMPRFWVWSEVKEYLSGHSERHIDFQSGDDGEVYYDLMSYQASNAVTMYRCKTSYRLNGGNALAMAAAAPNQTGNSNKWEAAMDGFGFIATKLVMADYGIVKNLCSEYIQCVKDGVTKFEVDRNGNVTANNGTFNNVRLAGALTAKSMSLQCERITSQLAFGIDGNSPHLLTYPLTIVDLDAIGLDSTDCVVSLALPYLTAANQTLTMDVLVTASSSSPARLGTLRFVATRANALLVYNKCYLTTCGSKVDAMQIDFCGDKQLNGGTGVTILGLYRCVGYSVDLGLSQTQVRPVTYWEVLRLSDGSEYATHQATRLRGQDSSAGSNSTGNFAYDITDVIVRGNEFGN